MIALSRLQSGVDIEQMPQSVSRDLDRPAGAENKP